MNKRIIVLVFVTLVACQTQNKNQADKNAIHKWITSYEEAIRTSDVATLLDGVSDAIVYFPPNRPALSGKENLKKWFLDYFNYYEASELLLARDIKITGDLAYLSCNYAVSVKVKHSGEEYRDIGKLVNVLKRESPGNWKCIYSIWNSNNHIIDFHSRIPADFSGEWELDLSKSTHVPNLISSRLIITQQGNNINIERFYEVQGKDTLMSELNCTIGREIKSKLNSESQITTSFWSPDKQSFTIVEKLLSAGKEYKRTTNYSLMIGGECLKIILFDQLPHEMFIPTGQQQIVMTYNKVQDK